MSKKNPHNLNWREAEFIYLYNALCGTEMKLLSKIGVKLVNYKIIGKNLVASSTLIISNTARIEI